MKKWSQFYTPPELANLLLDSIADKYTPTNVVDICAGSCNLISAAAQRWPNAKLFGSDIEKVSHKLIGHNTIPINKIDATDTKKIISTYKRKRKKIVLANPPFGYYKSLFKPSIPSHLKKLYNVSERVNRIECEILISNLSILNKGDYFAAILPENIFTGEKMEEFRLILYNFFEELVVKTHSIKFEKTEVLTRILTGIYNPKIKNKLSEINQDFTKNEQNIFQVIRGIDNSILMDKSKKKSNIKVLHFNNLNGDLLQTKTVAYNKKYESKFVAKNDILIFRVGRNAGKIFIPDNRHIGHPPSDLLLILKEAKKLGKRRLRNLEIHLQEKRKGLTSKYISKRDVLNSLNEVTVPNTM